MAVHKKSLKARIAEKNASNAVLFKTVVKFKKKYPFCKVTLLREHVGTYICIFFSLKPANVEVLKSN